MMATSSSSVRPQLSSDHEIGIKMADMISESNYLTCHRRKELNTQPYYHSDLRSKAEVKMFMSKAEPGEFLLRNSFTETGSYTFSLMHRTGVKHLKLNCHDGSSYSLKDQQFNSIEQLLLHYSTHAIPNSDNLPDVLLSKPILRRKMQGGDDSSVDYIHPIPSTTKTPDDEKPPPHHHYDSVRDVDVSVTEDVLRGLQLMDRSHREFCDCGLRMDDAELPRGWSVHLSSQDPQETTTRCSSSSRTSCCFMSPDGDLTQDLPLHVCLDLTSDQQNFIRRLMHDDADEEEDAGREGRGGEGGKREGEGEGGGGGVHIMHSLPTGNHLISSSSMANSYAFSLQDNAAVECSQL